MEEFYKQLQEHRRKLAHIIEKEYWENMLKKNSYHLQEMWANWNANNMIKKIDLDYLGYKRVDIIEDDEIKFQSIPKGIPDETLNKFYERECNYLDNQNERAYMEDNNGCYKPKHQSFWRRLLVSIFSNPINELAKASIELTSTNKWLSQRVEEIKNECSHLKNENEELLRTNANLETKISELENLLEKEKTYKIKIFTGELSLKAYTHNYSKREKTLQLFDKNRNIVFSGDEIESFYFVTDEIS
ncbi:MAG: hypothetical protein ACP5N7_02500 [Candidatus Pacearchaeota archaeon]